MITSISALAAQPTLALPFIRPYAYAFWGVFAWGVLMEFLQFRRKRAVSAGQSGQDGYSGYIISTGTMGLELTGFAVAYLSDWRLAPSHESLLFWIGLTLEVSGMLLRMHCWKMLGRFFTHTVTVTPDQKVVTGGAYSYLRHPSYSGVLLIFIGMGLALGSTPGFLIMVCGMVAIYIYRIEVEERALETVLGHAYTEFKKSRKRLIPFIY